MGWLDRRRTFSFAEYYDPDHQGFRALRVVNDDRMKAGMYVTQPGTGERRAHELAEGRHAWVQASSGAIRVKGTSLDAGDGASVSQEMRLEIEGREASTVLLFDLG